MKNLSLHTRSTLELEFRVLKLRIPIPPQREGGRDGGREREAVKEKHRGGGGEGGREGDGAREQGRDQVHGSTTQSDWESERSSCGFRDHGIWLRVYLPQ